MTNQRLKPIDRIGGREKVAAIVEKFYHQVFLHPILSQFFRDVTREHQQIQLTDFMVGLLGGERIFGGRLPQTAHEHILITEDHFLMRSQILRRTLEQAGLDAEMIEVWMGIDDSFKKVIVKKSPEDCKKRYKSDELIIVQSKKTGT